MAATTQNFEASVHVGEAKLSIRLSAELTDAVRREALAEVQLALDGVTAAMQDGITTHDDALGLLGLAEDLKRYADVVYQTTVAGLAGEEGEN